MPFINEKSLTARYVQFYAVRRKQMKNMTLREVCSTIGVSRRAVQGYEKEALVSATGKNNRGYLLYNAAAQNRIKKIKLYQDMGFSLKQIKQVIDDTGPTLRNALTQQREKLSQDIQQKNAMISIIQEMLKNLP